MPFEKQTFPVKEIDVSPNKLLWVACCPLAFGSAPYKITLVLEEEEAVLTTVSICGESVKRVPYGELGNVDRANCFCFTCVNSSLGPIQPGCCGCGSDAQNVDNVVSELKNRMKERGDTGQITRAEQQLEKLEAVEAKIDLVMKNFHPFEAKIDLIMKHLNIALPPDMESMERTKLN